MSDQSVTEAPTVTPCSIPECNADGTGEPCDRHETEQAHAEVEHAFCGIECETTLPSEQLRNAILCQAIPGSPAMLVELERRAARPAPAPEQPATDTLPEWEAAYDSTTYTPYLIGYLNDEVAAKAAALAWFRANCETDDVLAWEPEPRLAGGEWSQWFILRQADSDGTALATDIVVRRRAERGEVS